ncbi:MAG TPA: hypothetical protein VGS12_07590 [Caulobacteraceae bacterium]|nr:hypothetical protein [Caulobacteraceae bacterium]
MILAGAALCLAFNLPGHLSDDSVVQLAQGRSGLYNRWHPPVMAWLLGVMDGWRRGTGLFVCFDTALIASAFVLLVSIPAKASWLAAPLAAAFWASPQLIIYPTIVWKDVLFAAAAVAGFTLLAAAAAARRPNLALGLSFAAIPLFVLAALTRQNGALVLPFAAAAAGWLAAGRARAAPAVHGLAAGLGGLAVCAALALAATAALDALSDHEPSSTFQWEELQVYDLAGAMRLDPSLALPVLEARAPKLARVLRTAGAAAYTPTRVDPLRDLPPIHEGRAVNAAAVAAQWRALIVGHPLLYLRTRSIAFAWVLLTPRLDECLPIYVGVDGPAPQMAWLGLSSRYDQRDGALEAWADRFAESPIYQHGAWALAALALLVGFLKRRRPADIALAAMLASALAFAASFFVISVACDYRYLYFLDLATMAAALYAVASATGGDAAGSRGSAMPQ